MVHVEFIYLFIFKYLLNSNFFLFGFTQEHLANR